MAARLTALLVGVLLAGLSAGAQPFPPGYVDPAPILQAAARAVGVDNLKCITISGQPTAMPSPGFFGSMLKWL